MARNAAEWSRQPNANEVEWVDSRIYSDESVFEEELERIWKRSWLPLCHESELAEPYDFRTL